MSLLTSRSNLKGWWKISVSMRTLKELELIKNDLEEEKGEKVSYHEVIKFLLDHYKKRRES